MSQPSPREIVGGPRKGWEGGGWTLLRFGWPALVLGLGIVLGTVLTPPGPNGIVDQSVYGLSTEALAEGRWWTLISHAFLPVAAWPFILLGSMLFFAGLTPTLTVNPAWMGGWRTLAVFFAAAGAGVGAHLLFGSDELYSGPWAAAAGLVLYYLCSGRLRSMFAAARPHSRGRTTTASDAGYNTIMWWNAWFLLLVIGPGQNLFPSVLPGEGAVRFAIGALILVGGAIAVYAVTRLGSENARNTANRAVQVACMLMLLVVAGVVIVWLFEQLQSLIELPWASYLAGATVGLIAGLVERRRASAR